MEYNKIFVYGTLRKGRIQIVMPSAAPYIKLVGKGTVKGKLYNTGEYPAAIVAKNGKIHGEIIEIAEAKEAIILRMMDEYEEFDEKDKNGSLFIREVVEVTTNKDQKIKTWIYWYNKEVKGLKLIKDGIYRNRKTNL